MLFHVHMKVRLPRDLPAADAERIKAAEKVYAQDLQLAGKWLHLWRIAGRYENYSVFDCASNDELHGLLASLPLFPFMEILVTPLAAHPSSIR